MKGFKERKWIGVGTTTLKNNLQYVGMIVELLIIYFVIVRFRSKEIFNYMLIEKWHDLGLSPLVIAVNLSIRQFYQQNLVETGL